MTLLRRDWRSCSGVGDGLRVQTRRNCGIPRDLLITQYTALTKTFEDENEMCVILPGFHNCVGVLTAVNC